MPPRPYRRDLTSKAQALRRDPTPAERKLWFEFLSTHPLKFTRQKPLGRYVADFYCARLKLAIELDGDTHFTDSGVRYDATRTASLERIGIQVLRFSNTEVMEDFEGVRRRIDEVLGA